MGLSWSKTVSGCRGLGENTVINLQEHFDIFHLDQTRSKRKRRLIAVDPAHARPEGRGLRCLSPVNRPRAFMSLIQNTGHTSPSVAVTTITILLSKTCKVFLHASSAWAIPHFFSSERLAMVPDPKLLFRSNWLSANFSCVLKPVIKHSATTFAFPKKCLMHETSHIGQILCPISWFQYWLQKSHSLQTLDLTDFYHLNLPRLIMRCVLRTRYLVCLHSQFFLVKLDLQFCLQ